MRSTVYAPAAEPPLVVSQRTSAPSAGRTYAQVGVCVGRNFCGTAFTAQTAVRKRWREVRLTVNKLIRILGALDPESTITVLEPLGPLPAEIIGSRKGQAVSINLGTGEVKNIFSKEMEDAGRKDNRV